MVPEHRVCDLLAPANTFNPPEGPKVELQSLVARVLLGGLHRECMPEATGVQRRSGGGSGFWPAHLQTSSGLLVERTRNESFTKLVNSLAELGGPWDQVVNGTVEKFWSSGTALPYLPSMGNHSESRPFTRTNS